MVALITTAVEAELLQGNFHFARHIRCFTRQFCLNDNLAMKNGKPEKRRKFFVVIFKIPVVSLNIKSDQAPAL